MTLSFTTFLLLSVIWPDLARISFSGQPYAIDAALHKQSTKGFSLNSGLVMTQGKRFYLFSPD